MSENLGAVHAEIRLALDRLAGDVAQARSLLREAADEADNTTRQASEQASRNYEKIGGQIKDTGKTITAFGVATVAGLGYAVKSAASFDTAMREAGAIAGANEQEFEKMRKAAIKLGADTTKNANEVAGAMTELAAKGFDANQVIDAMPGIIAAAEASGEDLAMTSDTVASALNIWGLEAGEASRVADVLSMSANVSAAGVADLGTAFSYAGAPAAALGISMEELAGAVGIMTDAGLDGSTAGTSLRASLLALNNPGKQQTKMLDEMGVSLKDQHGEAKSLSEIIGELTESTKDMSDADRVATIGKLVGTNAVSGFLSLMDAGPEKMDKMTAALKDSEGAAAETAAQMQAGIGGAIEQMGGAFDSLAITIGDVLVPYVAMAAEFIAKLVDKLTNMNPALLRVIVIGTAVAGAIALIVGPILILIGTALPGLITLFGFISGTAFPALIASVAPVIGVILAVIAVGAALYFAWKNNFGGIRDFVMEVVGYLITKFHELKDFVMPIITELVSYIVERWKAIQPVVQTVMDVIGAIIGFILPFIFDTVKFYLDAVMNVFKGVFNIIAGVIKFFVALFTGDWKGMWEAVKQMLSGAVQAVWGLFQLWFVGRIAGIFGKFISGIISKVRGWVSGIISSVTSMVTRFASAITGLVTRVVSSFTGFFTRIRTSTGSWISNVVTTVVNGMARFVTAIATALTRAVTNFAKFVLDIPKKLGSVISKVTTIGKDIVKGIWSGITGMGSWLAGKLTSFAKSIIPGPIAKALGIASPSKLMADEIGHWLPPGIADGAEDNMRPITDMAGVLAKRLTKDVKGKMDVANLAADLSLEPSINNANRVVQGTGVSEEYNFNGPLIGEAHVRDDRDVKSISQALYTRISNKGRTNGQVVLG